MTQRSPTDLKADPAPVESGPAFLDALRATVGPRHVLTRPQDTERFRMDTAPVDARPRRSSAPANC